MDRGTEIQTNDNTSYSAKAQQTKIPVDLGLGNVTPCKATPEENMSQYKRGIRTNNRTESNKRRRHSISENSAKEHKNERYMHCGGDYKAEQQLPNINGRSGRRLSLVTSALTAKARMDKRRLSYIVGMTKAPQNELHYSNLFTFGTTRIQRLVTEMKQCISTVGGQASNQDLESWACIIYESMSASSRTFHSVQHVFDVAIGADAIQKLATFFHDIVYYQIDGGLNKDQDRVIGDIINVTDDAIYITDKEYDRNTLMTIDIFGFEPGQKLDPFKGLNEFLSAAIAIRCYEGNVEPTILLQIAACIELTIPFRPDDKNGHDPAESLFHRLVKVNEKYNLAFSEDDLVKAVQRAADLGNRDLANFCTPERAVFLSNTWNLLPESNISLRNTTVFRSADFALALKKMTGFFEFLDPELVYMSFRDPGEKKLVARKTEMARTNIEVATKYMHCKQLSIAIVAAIAELSGGDAPLALFLGDLPERHHVSTSIDDLIFPEDPKEGLEMDHRVFELLRNGRESESNFDIKHSPLAAYLYSLVGDEGVNKSLKHAVHPMDEDHAWCLLKSLPMEAIATIVAACAEIAITRVDALDQIMKALVKVP